MELDWRLCQSVRELSPDQFSSVGPLFKPLHHYLAVQAVLARSVSGRVFVDHPIQPRSAFVSIERRNFFAGSPDNETFNEDLSDLLTNTIYAAWLASGGPILISN